LLSFGEETSWLQHQLGYATPGVVSGINSQGEFNLHNLSIFQGGELLGKNRENREIGLSLLLKSQHLFQLGFFAYFLVLPILTLTPTIALITKLRVPYPGWRLFGNIWLSIGLTILFTVFANEATKPIIAETRELLYALTILVFLILWVRLWRYGRGQQAQPFAGTTGLGRPT
jgi:hypothetical protein